MPSRADVDQAIRSLIVRTLMLEESAATDLPLHEEDFLSALGANSIDILELMIAVEEHFGFEFADEQLRPELVHTLDRFVSETYRLVEAAAEGRPGSPAPAPSAAGAEGEAQ
jgi:acyl carrier protein